MDKLFTELLRSLQDPSDEVVLAVLEVFAEITSVSDSKFVARVITFSKLASTSSFLQNWG